MGTPEAGVPDEYYKPDMHWEVITPAVAEQRLTDAAQWASAVEKKANRSVSNAKVEKYAADRRAGRFFGEVADPVVMEEVSPGKFILKNGFHRHNMVLVTGLPTGMHVLYNSRPGAVLGMDQGRPRSLADFFTMSGQECGTILAQAAGYYAEWLEKNEGRKEKLPRAVQFLPLRGGSLTNPVGIAFVEEHPELVDAVVVATRLYGRKRSGTKLAPGLVAFLYVIFSRERDEETALTFFTEAESGHSDPKRATSVLHQRIVNERLKLKGANNGFSAPDQLKVVVPAWDNFIAQIPVTKIQRIGVRTSVKKSAAK